MCTALSYSGQPRIAKERAMARIKHIALSTDDPAKTAEFYKNVFGLTELRRTPSDTGAEGVWLSDGYIYFAILKYGGGENPHLRGGASTAQRGHHNSLFVVVPGGDTPP